MTITCDSRIVVYTVITGGYDCLRPGQGEANWVCFTDATADMVKPWSRRQVQNSRDIDSRVRQARRIKLLPHEFLPSHEVSIWVDGNLQLTATPTYLATFVAEHHIATFSYPDTFGFRDCAYEEARACMERKKDREDLIKEQMERYRRLGFPEHFGLAETSLLVRRNSDVCRKLNETWWNELKRGSRRDQLSFNFACWKTRSTYRTLPGSRVKSPLATFFPHEFNIYDAHPSLHS